MKLADYKKRLLENLQLISKRMDLLNKEIKDLTKHLDSKDIHTLYEMQIKLNELITLDKESENLINQIIDINKIENE